MQRIIRLIESRHVIHMWRANQSAVEPVGPRMIRTLNRGRVSACVLFQSRAAMPTNIVKRSDL